MIVVVRPGKIKAEYDTEVLATVLGRDICLTEVVSSINSWGAPVIKMQQTTLGYVKSKPTVGTPAVNKI